MAIAAPRCSQPGCENLDWEGTCHIHRRAYGPAPTAAPAPPPAPGRGVAERWDDLAEVIDDLGDVVHPALVRAEAVAALVAAVGTECARRGGGLDAAQLGEMAASVADEMAPDLSRAVDAGEAYELARSASDSYGRSLADSRALVGYLLREERGLALSMGVVADADEVAYSTREGDYLAAAWQTLVLEAEDEGARATYRLMHPQSGAEEAVPSVGAEESEAYAAAKGAADQVEAAAAIERARIAKEVAIGAGALALSAVGGLWNVATDASGARAQRAERAQAARARRQRAIDYQTRQQFFDRARWGSGPRW